eukprot:gene21223-biopygen16255
MRLTEERRRRDAALGSIGPIRIRERRDSREAQLFLDYVEQHVLTPRRIVLHRQKYLRLCRSEIDWLQGKYTEFFGGGELLLRAPRFFTVDGMFTDYEQHGGREQRCIIEFDGCYWHACTRAASKCREKFADKTYARNRRRMTGEQVRTLDEFRRAVLRRRGYRVFVMKECTWRERCGRRDGSSVHVFVEERRRQHEDDPLERNDNWAGYTTQDTLIEALLHGKVHGMVTCDVHVPQERREYFKEFAPIIKHAFVDYADVGEFTQAVADANGIAIKKRKCVIDSYVGHEITITDEYFVWLLEHGCKCTKIYSFLRWKKEPVFAEFGREITRLRVQGDRDKSSEMKANTAKLIGNSAFGSCITNKDKHRDVRLVSLQQDGDRSKTRRMLTSDQVLSNRRARREIASMNTFVRYEQVCRQVLEVETKKRRVVYDQPRYIGKTIFDRAKLSVLTFVYDFLKSVLKPDHFELLETDTDSIYLALKEDRFEDNVAEEKRDEYERKKDVYFITDRCEFGKRQPNRYKLEFSGHRMVSLCSKSYCGFDETSRDVKISSKGVQKRNFVQHALQRQQQQQQDDNDDGNKDVSEIIYDIYKEGLKTDPNANCKTHAATNRGIKRKQNLMQTYAQEKNMLNSLYCKRRVLEDGISTIEEILKGTGLGRMKKRMKMEIGHHVANNYVSPFKNLYSVDLQKTRPLFGKGQARLSSKMLREHGLLPDAESGGGGGDSNSVDDDGFVYNQVDPELLYKKKLDVFRHNLSKELLNVVTNYNQNKNIEEQNKTDDTGQQRRISKKPKQIAIVNMIAEDDDDDHDPLTDQDEQYLHRYADDIEQYYASIADEILQQQIKQMPANATTQQLINFVCDSIYYGGPQEQYDFRFKTPFTVMLAGKTKSGKTELVLDILQQWRFITDDTAGAYTKKLYWFYGTRSEDQINRAKHIWDGFRDELQDGDDTKNIAWHPVKGVESQEAQTRIEEMSDAIVVFDDLMTEMTKSDKMSQFFTRESHHRNLCMFFRVARHLSPAKARRNDIEKTPTTRSFSTIRAVVTACVTCSVGCIPRRNRPAK